MSMSIYVRMYQCWAMKNLKPQESDHIVREMLDFFKLKLTFFFQFEIFVFPNSYKTWVFLIIYVVLNAVEQNS